MKTLRSKKRKREREREREREKERDLVTHKHERVWDSIAQVLKCLDHTAILLLTCIKAPLTAVTDPLSDYQFVYITSFHLEQWWSTDTALSQHAYMYMYAQYCLS